MAAITSSLRVISGMHFLSDVLTGAAVGSLIGYLIPLIHETNENQSGKRINSVGGNFINLVIEF